MDNKACKKWLFLYFSESNISIFRSRRININGHRKSKNNIRDARSLVLQWHASQHPQHVKQNLSKNNIYLADLSVYLHHLYFFSLGKEVTLACSVNIIFTKWYMIIRTLRRFIKITSDIQDLMTVFLFMRLLSGLRKES